MSRTHVAHRNVVVKPRDTSSLAIAATTARLINAGLGGALHDEHQSYCARQFVPYLERKSVYAELARMVHELHMPEQLITIEHAAQALNKKLALEHNVIQRALTANPTVPILALHVLLPMCAHAALPAQTICSSMPWHIGRTVVGSQKERDIELLNRVRYVSSCYALTFEQDCVRKMRFYNRFFSTDAMLPQILRVNPWMHTNVARSLFIIGHELAHKKLGHSTARDTAELYKTLGIISERQYCLTQQEQEHDADEMSAQTLNLGSAGARFFTGLGTFTSAVTIAIDIQLFPWCFMTGYNALNHAFYDKHPLSFVRAYRLRTRANNQPDNGVQRYLSWCRQQSRP